MSNAFARMERQFAPSLTEAVGDTVAFPRSSRDQPGASDKAIGGDPALAVELLPGMWTAFSLSPESAKMISELLHDMLKPGHAVN